MNTIFEEGIEFEFCLIPIVHDILIEHPNPRLERQTRNAEEYFFNMGYDYDVFVGLHEAAIEHVCKEYKKILMASRIKRLYKRAKSDPNYKMCRDRLLQEYNEITTST